LTTAKEVRVSIDSGVTYFLLPGGTGEWNDEGEQITDTIFGQTFQSTQPGLITWSANANALYKGFAGYVASLKETGTAIQMTAEATTLVSGKTYQINDTDRRIVDWTKAVVIDDGGVPVAAADIESIDHMFGKVTFTSSYTPSGAITFDAWYLPLTEIAQASSFTLTQTAETIDETDFATANSNGGYRVFNPGLRTVALELGGFYNAASAFWTVLEGRQDIVIEINPDGSNLSVARGVFKLVTRSQSGDIGALEEESRTFNLSVPASDTSLGPALTTVFSWQHDATTTLSQAIQNLLTFWLSQSNPDVQYLPEGLDQVGFEGTAVITDVSLSSGLDAMNEFTANFQGTGAPTRGIISA
jgi:hypothetical protein